MRCRIVVISLLMLLLISSIGSARPADSPSITTLTIMNFTNRSPTGEWQWLSKGLADMLITDLSQAGELQVVERERMQKLFEEMALSTTGLIDEATATSFGKVAKVDKALFGSFCPYGTALLEDKQGRLIVFRGPWYTMSEDGLTWSNAMGRLDWPIVKIPRILVPCSMIQRDDGRFLALWSGESSGGSKLGGVYVSKATYIRNPSDVLEKLEEGEKQSLNKRREVK